MKYNINNRNAQFNVSGSFVYSPSVGTVLKAGNNQVLSVTFTPDDATIYGVATATVTINVNLTTGMNDDVEPELSLSPNPATDYVTINGSVSIERLSFVNAVGQTVMVALGLNRHQFTQAGLVSGESDLYQRRNRGVAHGKTLRIIKQPCRFCAGRVLIIEMKHICLLGGCVV